MVLPPIDMMMNEKKDQCVDRWQHYTLSYTFLRIAHEMII